MTYCCENIRRAYELISDAQNRLDWSPKGPGFGDVVKGFFAINISSVKTLSDYLQEAGNRMVDAYNTLNRVQVEINFCSCGSEKNSIRQNVSSLGEKASSLIREYERL